MKASEVIQSLKLVPLTVEGGYFCETYRSTGIMRRGDAERCAGTCIYYLLDKRGVSAWHKVASDEIWLYQAGVPARQLLLFEDGSWEERIIGPDLANGERPQSVIPAGTWQAAVLDDRKSAVVSTDDNDDTVWGLFSAVVVPGFEYTDFQSGTAEELAPKWPDASSLILDGYNF